MYLQTFVRTPTFEEYREAFKEDGRRNVFGLIFDLEIPNIGALNGPGFHSELCLMCDLTICSEDADGAKAGPPRWRGGGRR